MKDIRTVDEIYEAIEELTKKLEEAGGHQLATILHHRMHAVAWTSGTELLEELRSVLADAQAVPAQLSREVEELSGAIASFLKAL